MPKRRRRLRKIGAWNMKVGRGRAAITGLRQLVGDHDPDAILLQEAMNYVVAIRAAFPGWRVYSSGLPFTEAGNCPVMVRRSVPRGRGGRVRNRVDWFYDNHGRSVRKSGRTWRWIKADGVYLMSIHRATNALGTNVAAGREEAGNIADWFDSHAGPMLAAGDWNNLHSDRRTNSPSDIAKQVGGKLVVPPEARIDYALTRGLKVVGRRGSKYGSDHPCTIYTKEKP